MEPETNMRAYEGALIGERFRLDRYLAEGSFGAVYRATQQAYGVPLRQVAIKIAKRPMSDKEASKVFGDALLMARLVDNAPKASLRERFVLVYDAGRCPDTGPLPGHPYLVMEYVHGGSLHDALKSGPFPLTRTIAYFEQIMEAMDFMHGGMDNPIIHRDLKPDNILVTRSKDGPDRVKVTDFGLAVEVDTLLGWVQSGGDLAYLAPESFTRNISSPQSDVYMLGLVFYEMLTGENPFSQVGTHLRGETEEKRAELRRLHVAARQMESFTRLSRHEEMRNKPALLMVIQNALANDMSNRVYENACELRAAWQQATRTISAANVPEKTPPWEIVRHLTSEAEQCQAVADFDRADELLSKAMQLNRDQNQVPNSMIVGQAYYLTVQRLLQQGKNDEAGKLAYEGYKRHRSRSTCRAVGLYYEALRSPLAANFFREGDTLQD